MPAASATIAAPVAYDTTPNVALLFEPDTLVFHALSGSFIVSFDGVSDHLLLQTAHGPLVVPSKRRKIWVKQNGGASNANISALTLA